VELADKVALVTGAAMGIGLGVAQALAEAGARVVVADRESEAGRGGGAIVNVASVAGLGAGPHSAPEYAAAKAGVVRFTAALGSLAGEGIRVNAICRDYVDTPAVQRSVAAMSEEERAALPPLVPPAAIAGGVLDLIRDDSLAGRVLVRFADGEPHLLTEAVPDGDA
jgi:NAD(P)-dependent dehydrogenase (short-subunit alcohol dehydrogenase family)